MRLRCLFTITVATTLLFSASPLQAQDEQPAADSPASLSPATPSHADPSHATNSAWVELIGESGPVGIAKIGEGLTLCSDVSIDDDSKDLTTVDGTGVVATLKKLKYDQKTNIFSKQAFGDCEVQLEFLIGKGSNSGIKLQGLYEVQLYDSYGKENPAGTDCGGIYPHWVFKQRDGKRKLTYTDDGYPPLVNAAKPAGQWQTLKIIFKAPRFDATGKKTTNARIDLVELNGITVQKDVELDSATGKADPPREERAEARIMLQMDHGAIAFRNARVLPAGQTATESGQK